MEVITELEAVRPDGPCAVTIGFFDGVHRGHQTVIRRLVAAAEERDLRPVAVTFDRHPREVLTPGDVPGLLTTTDRKAHLIEELGVDLLVVMPFDAEVASWPPERFVDDVLVERLGVAHATVGANFTFGHRAAGTVEVLTDLGRARGFSVEGVGLLEVEGRRISSTSIREALAAGDLEWPRVALGRRHVIDGVVVPGAGRGDDLGWPTANLQTDPRALLPARGVYAGRGLLEEGAWPAAINVGINPTFGEEPLHVEAFLLGFEGDIRGRDLAIELWERLRDEERFESSEALSRQIERDVERTRAVVSE
ncbi:MAG TPA: bifunctional riboflavin kinase/FAD synthetase [Actinomycetota bacterium]